MKQAVKRLPAAVVTSKVEVLPPARLRERRAPAPMRRSSSYEEVTEVTTRRMVKRHHVEAPVMSSEPAASMVGRVFSLLVLLFMLMITASLAVVGFANGSSFLAFVALICAMGLAGVTVSIARYDHA